MNTYFITGATGVLGSAIVQILLKNTSDKLILLIRAEDEDSLQKRIEWLFGFLEINIANTAERVNCIRGDVELENLGLSAQQFISLGDSVTHIIHSAATVRMNLPLERARRAAVVATENILALARLCKQNNLLQKVEIVSTVGVGGRWRGALPERWINESRVFHNTYEQAKAEAEGIIESQVAKGMPITVHRPSMIVGNSFTGRIPYFQIFYDLIEFVVGRRTSGLLPDLSHRYVDLIPVDFVAQVVVWSNSTSQTIGRVLHLCGGPKFAVSLEELRIIAQKKFKEKKISTPRQFTFSTYWFKIFIKLMTLFKSKKNKRSCVMVTIFLDYLSEDQIFDNTNTLYLINSIGFHIPKTDDYLDIIINYYIEEIYSNPRTQFPKN